MFDRGKKKWGIRTIHMKLRDEQGITMNHKKIERIMNKYHLVTKVRKKNPHKAGIKRTLEHRTFPNILNRQFQQEEPRKVFCTDITYLPFYRKTAYLSVVKDIASREIVSWNLSLNMKLDLVLRTLENVKPYLTGNPILLHSDQGTHYSSPQFVAHAKRLNLVQSMSRKGTCVDNAPMESFFGHFKDEVEYRRCETFEELQTLTAAYMDYYNTGRQQWNLNKMTPATYREYLLTGGP